MAFPTRSSVFPIVLIHSFPNQQTLSVFLFCPWVLKYRKKSFASIKRQSSSNEERQNKEPRSCSSSEGSLSSALSVKDILRRRIEQKQAQQNEELVSNSQDNSTLTDWASMLSSAGFFCEVRSMVQSDLLPFPSESKAPAFALIVEQSEKLQFSPGTGPFQPARLVLYPDGQWRVDSPILEYRKIADGKLGYPSTELVNLAQQWLSETRVRSFAQVLLALLVMTCSKNWATFPKMCTFLMAYPCIQRPARYGTYREPITASQTMGDFRRCAGIVSLANDM